MAGNFFSNFVSDTGKNLGLPVIFDWDTNAAQKDALTGAAAADGSAKRSLSSVAAKTGGSLVQQQLAQDNYFNSLKTGTQNIDDGAIDDGALNNWGTGGGGGGGSAYSARDTQAAYDDQISALQQLLGYTDTQRDAGLSTMRDRAAAEKRNLDAQRARAMSDYDAKSVQSAQDKQSGINTVDSYANDSYQSLQRLLRSGNAGNSSAARELVPQLVSKSAGTRRQGVFETAGKNDQAITSARDDAEVQYGANAEELENNRKSQEQSFLETIYGKQNELQGSLGDLQVKRAMANGQGYAAARAAGDAARNSVSERQNQLASLFGQYKPTFAAKQINAKQPELGKFTVDRAQINSQQSGLPAESSYYLNQLNKKKQIEQGL